MAAEKKCCVHTCGSASEILHKFPHPEKDIDRFRTWMYKIGGDILSLDNMYIYKYRKVCHLHFEPSYHTRHKKLSANAIPTLHLPAFSRRLPMKDITNKSIPDYHTTERDPVAIPSTSGTVENKQKYTAQIEVPQIPRQVNPKDKNIDKKSVISSSTAKYLVKQIKKLQDKNDSFKQRLKKSNKLCTNSTFLKALEKFKTLAAIFTMMQFREVSKPKMGRRFTKNEKLMALTVYKRSPKCYRWLSQIFILPSSATLSRILAKANLKPGINEKIFQQLEQKAQSMKSNEKLCTLIFDEMALSPHFDYNRKKDKISGFVNYMGEPSKKIADHVLVFMIRGIIKNYKQHIYYSFCSGSTPKMVLVAQIQEIIKKLQSIGFTVLATVCDQGTSNMAAINWLIETSKQKYIKENKILKHRVFEISGNIIIPLYDVPHLLKGLRNNLITKNLKYMINGEEKTAKWEHITNLFENNPTYKGLKLVKNLSESHCIKEKIPKMKVKYAAQLFSQTVGRTMGYLADQGVLPEDSKHTADLIIFIDNLFDSLNGSFSNSRNRGGKDLLRNVTPHSRHSVIWIEAKNILRTMKFVTMKGKAGTVPSINNFIHTIENMELLRDKLFLDYNIKSLWCRHLNQDALENFFGCIRSHGVRNTSPTCTAFESAFATLLVNNFTSNYAPGSNCEKDSCEIFASFNNLFFSNNEETRQETCEIDYNNLVSNQIITNFEETQRDPRIKGMLQTVTGYILRLSKKTVFNDCRKCKKDLFDKNSNDYLKYREYVKNTRSLTYSNLNLRRFFCEIQDVVFNVLKDRSENTCLKLYIKTILYVVINCNFITCTEHQEKLIDFMFDFSSRFLILQWCKSTNKLLNGTSRHVSPGDLIQEQALLYHMKRKKK